MDAVLYPLAVYLFLLLVFRIAGKRSLAQATIFDLVLVLIIAEATQQALLGEDFSLLHAFIAVTTFVVLDIVLGFVKQRSRRLDAFMDGLPLVVLEDGKLLHERARRERVDEADILAAARQLHGLERLEQVKYAVVESSGAISIIPKR